MAYTDVQRGDILKTKVARQYLVVLHHYHGRDVNQASYIVVRAYLDQWPPAFALEIVGIRKLSRLQRLDRRTGRHFMDLAMDAVVGFDYSRLRPGKTMRVRKRIASSAPRSIQSSPSST